MKQLHLKIYGRVHGVFYRDSALKEAQKHNIVGWVKNMSDTTVEIVAQGSEQSLKNLISWCNDGPELARVEKVEETWENIENKSFDNFKIVY